MNQRNIVFDQIKGLLIILVIIGHVALGEVNENPLRSYLYFFHMPLFLAITGYFIKDGLFKLSNKEILKKYKNRLLIPYCIAFVFYTSIQLLKVTDIKGIVHLFLYPFYHLWYIPAMMAYIFYYKYLTKLKNNHNIYIYMVVSILFVLCTAYFEYYRQWDIVIDNPYLRKIYALVGDKRFYFYFSYFAIGVYLSKTQKILKNTYSIAICTLIALFGIAVYQFVHYPLWQGFGKFLTNCSLIFLVISFAKMYCLSSDRERLLYRNKWALMIAKLGVISLPIYLWHQFPIMVMKKVIHHEIGLYVTAALFFIVFLYCSVKLEGKNKYIDQYIYGKK